MVQKGQLLKSRRTFIDEEAMHFRQFTTDHGSITL
ncbi:Uncharacterised protein [Vibrio cholerae]|nr:Uncharacterised protein [Vibrio cholerae]